MLGGLCKIKRWRKRSEDTDRNLQIIQTQEDLARDHGSEAITQSPTGVDGLRQGKTSEGDSSLSQHTAQ